MKYVCTGSILRCSMGTATCKLRATPKRVTLMGEDQANVNDYISKVNIPGFGLCRSLKYPPTASATAAHHGTLTPMPCVPGTCPRWKTIDKCSLICDEPALLQPSTLRCVFGGTISIVAPGQRKEIKVMAVALAAEETIDEIDQLSEEELAAQMKQDSEQLVNEPLDKENVVEGIHLALDVAGFIPGLGAVPDILNAAIYAAEGNFGMASFSILAAVPLVGDVAVASKIAYKGAKVAQKVGKVDKVVKKVEIVKGTTAFSPQNAAVKKMPVTNSQVTLHAASKTDNIVPITSAHSMSRNAASNAGIVKNDNKQVEKTRIYRISRKEQKIGNGENSEIVSIETEVIRNDISIPGRYNSHKFGSITGIKKAGTNSGGSPSSGGGNKQGFPSSGGRNKQKIESILKKDEPVPKNNEPVDVGKLDEIVTQSKNKLEKLKKDIKNAYPDETNGTNLDEMA